MVSTLILIKPSNLMKAKFYLFLLFVFVLFQVCKAQKTPVALPKITNYHKGELEIKVAPFGLDDPIAVGKISTDGTIHFNFPETELDTTDETPLYSAQKIGRAVGMFVCHDKEIVENTKTVTAIEVKDIFLYKYGQQVGALLQATNEEALNNEFGIGSTLSWFISSGEGVFKATCFVYEDDSSGKGGLDKNNLRNKTSYDITFTKGWNIVEHKLLETKELEDDRGKYSRRLIEEKISVAKIPNTINWYLKYWANDEYLEIEHQLAMQKPLTKEKYKAWVPKKLGDLKRTSYAIGKELERIPTPSNVELLFENGAKKVTITIVDCADNKEAATMYTLMLDMASTDWKDETETGYKSASKMNGTRVITEYDENEAKTLLSYNADNRFLIKADALHIDPEELWGYMQELAIENLVN